MEEALEKKKEVEESKESEPAEEQAPSESPDLILKATAAAERLEKANEKLSELIGRQERLRVESVLGGKSEAGSVPKSKEELGIESAKKMLEGTGYEDILDAQ